MATKKKPLGLVRADAPPVQEVELGEHTANCLTIYGAEVNLDRAVVDIRDGLKPVTRRILWAMHTMRGEKLIKTARLVGETMGKYHPHGDASISGAVTTQVVTDTPPITGVGNWGSIIDPPAATRYTNVAMSKFGELFFHKNYLPLVNMVDNYDGKGKEPLVLPSLLPNVLMNGATGIGLGMATSYPSFTPKSLLNVLADLADGQKLSDEVIASRLEFYHKYGGVAEKSKHTTDALVALLGGPRATVRWKSPFTVNREAKEITISAFGPEISPVKLIEDWVKARPEVAMVYSGRGVSYTIRCRRDLNYQEFDLFVSKFEERVRSSQSYDLYVTKRVARDDDPSKYDVKFARMSLRRVLTSWLSYRIDLEKRSLEWQVAQCEKQIRYYDLLLHACANLDIIFEALRSPDPRAVIVKGLRISAEDADIILNLKVRQLSSLDGDEIRKHRGEQNALMKGLKQRLKKPQSEVATFLRHYAEEFKLVKNDWSTQWQL